MNELSTGRAWHFGARSTAGAWVWRGDKLFDARDTMIADVRAEVLRVDAHRLLLERSPDPMTFGLRGTAVDGTVYMLAQTGFTVAQLEADCQGRPYQLYRRKPWSKSRIITDASSGNRVVRVRPRFDGSVEIDDGLGFEDVDLVDVAFMTYGCKLVDSPGRNLRI